MGVNQFDTRLGVPKPAPKVRPAPIGERGGLRTYAPINPVNKERRARRYGETHGPHGEWVATLPCCACMPEHYHHAPLKPFLLRTDQSRISDPHHVTTRAAGGKAEACVPLCRMHHDLIDSVGWGQATFEASYRIDLSLVASLLWDESPVRGDAQEGGR